MSGLLASVVVPTRDRPGPLARCLGALRVQRHIDLELVVVDDGSADAREIERVVRATEGSRLLRLEGQGPAAARNAGIRAASADVVLLTDDDCAPSPGWAAELGRAVAASNALVVGRTVFDRRQPLVFASETIVAHAERTEPFAATRNVGLRRELAVAVPFDERFREAGGEDREWCRRLARSGTPLVVAPAAVVFHDPELDLARFWRQHLRYGRAAGEDRGQSVWEPHQYAQLVVGGFRRGPRVGALVLLAQAATVVGYAHRPPR